MSIKSEIEEFVLSLNFKDEISTKEFKTQLSKQYGRPKNCYIPSDYCYNRTNFGINYDSQPHYFMYVKRGIYQYVGKNYQFDGEIEHKPKNKKVL